MSLENFVMTLNDFQDTVFGHNSIICRDIFLPYREEKCHDKSLKYCNKYCTSKSKCHDMFEVTADQNAQAFRYVTTMLIPIPSGSRNPNSFLCRNCQLLLDDCTSIKIIFTECFCWLV